MPVSMTIRDVPDETRDVLAARAARGGQSLQEYVRAQLKELAERPEPEKLWDRVRHRLRTTHTHVSTEFILDAKDRDRA
ncbi:FitA-like ribbon-helix-helix domain-containing protein [Blastococcus deserti]